MDTQAFFTVHQDLPREGPGEAADVAWACALAGIAPDAVICDAGAGPGGDLTALAASVPQGHVVGIERHGPFVQQARARVAGFGNVSVADHDMAQIGDLPQAPFDMIWCAGALYFLGLDAGLATMASALKPGGVLAFSEPCFFQTPASDAARAFWEGYPTRDAAGIAAAIDTAGFDVLQSRPVSDAGWEAYYAPQDARIADLRAQADDRLTAMLDLCAAEARDWRTLRRQTGYLLTVARLK